MADNSITNVSVTDTTTDTVLLSNGTGSWDQYGETITCGTFYANPGFPQNNHYFTITFTDSNNQQNNITNCQSTVSGANSTFSAAG